MPKRLTRLGEDTVDTVRLMCSSRSVQYAALSYCWGSSKQPVMTEDNIASQEVKVSVKDLPQKLQDYIFVTRESGLEDVWMDTMCIVQDDADDRATESSKMADIYSGAWVVLAAT
jgi:hypothetical protein